MTTFTETDFRQLFRSREQFDEWLKTEFLEVRTDGPQPGLWMDVDGIECMSQMHRSEKDVYLLQHPLHDLSAPVLPFPFEMADFMALANSDCFMHSSARWPEDADVERAQAINPRTKALMMELLGHMLPAPQAESAAPPNASPAVRAEPLLTTAADAPALSASQVVPVAASWALVKPTRCDGLATPIHRVLKLALSANSARPSARDVLESFRVKLPPEVARVLADGCDYFDTKGNEASADLESIRKRIDKMTRSVRDV